MKQDELLTEDQAADYVQLNRKYFCNLRRTRRGPPFVRSSPHKTLYRISDLDAWKGDWDTGNKPKEAIVLTAAEIQSLYDVGVAELWDHGEDGTDYRVIIEGDDILWMNKFGSYVRAVGSKNRNRTAYALLRLIAEKQIPGDAE
jgi:hypothetical protein